MIKTGFTAVIVAAAFGLTVPAIAAPGPNLVTNGSFEGSSYTSNTQIGPYFGGQGVTGWTAGGNGGPGSGLEFYYIGGTQDSVNAVNEYGDPKGYFYPSFTTLSPDGGNFVALDGDSNVTGTILQQINGLTVGKTYKLSFDWAATQLINRSGQTTEQIKVLFGGDTALTPTYTNPSGGFTPAGWATWTGKFTATSSSQLLEFLSIGTPNGLPPIAVLDGVSLTQTPEPAALALLGVGFAGLGASRLRRR